MKATELQIGDYVIYGDKEIKVESLTKKKVGYHLHPEEHNMHYARLSEVYPYSITPGLLEDTGCFTAVRVDNTCALGRWVLLVEAFCEVTIWNDNRILLRIEKTLDGGWGVNKVHNCTIQHLHELQHAMRLCGIEKELTL